MTADFRRMVWVFLLSSATLCAQELTLHQAITFALAHNDREMYRTELNYKTARLQHEISLGEYKPQLNASVNASRSHSRLLNESDVYTSDAFTASPRLNMSYNLRTPLGSKTRVSLGYQSQIDRRGDFYHSPSLNLSYTQPLSLAGMQSGHLDYIRTQQGFLSSEMTYKNRRESFILTVINRYFDLWRSLRDAGQNRKNLASARRMLSIAELKLKAGEISEFEVLNTRVQYQLARDNAEVSKNNLENQKKNFKRLLGCNPDKSIILSAQIHLDTVDISVEEAVENALEHRLDAKQWRIDLQLADLSLKQSRATAWPDLQVSSRYSLSSSYDTPYGTDLSRFPFRQWSVSAGLSFNIIDGGKRSRTIQRARLSRQLKDKEWQLYRDDLRLAMEKHLRTLDMNLRRIASLETNLRMAEESLRIAELKFNQSTISTADVENVRDRYRQAQQSYDSAKIDYIKNSAQLARDMGLLDTWVDNLSHTMIN